MTSQRAYSWIFAFLIFWNMYDVPKWILCLEIDRMILDNFVTNLVWFSSCQKDWRVTKSSGMKSIQWNNYFNQKMISTLRMILIFKTILIPKIISILKKMSTLKWIFIWTFFYFWKVFSIWKMFLLWELFWFWNLKIFLF